MNILKYIFTKHIKGYTLFFGVIIMIIGNFYIDTFELGFSILLFLASIPLILNEEKNGMIFISILLVLIALYNVVFAPYSHNSIDELYNQIVKYMYLSTIIFINYLRLIVKAIQIK